MAYVENAPHNPEVVGSNPAPATKNLQLVGLAGELFSCALIGCFLGGKAMGARITRFRFTRAGSGRRFLRCVACLGHLGHLGDVSCCKATMSRQENDAVALRIAMASRRAHNPEVVGSNPAPATKNLQLVGLAGELFSFRVLRVYYPGTTGLLQL